MKIIFLDIDGVLNCDNSKSRCGNFVGIDKDKVQKLASIVKQTNAKMVLISDWKDGWEPFKRYDKKLNPHAKYLDDHLEKKGDLYLIDKTKDKSWQERGNGIKEWLAKHLDVTDWVILDDFMFEDYMNDAEILKHLVWTNSHKGLTEEDVEKALQILNKEN